MGHTQWMSGVSPVLRSTGSQITGFVRFLCRMMVCLSLWSAPVPLLHAHENAGPILDRDPDLAVHVLACHAQDDCDHCRGWHLHLVLWGEIQSDHSDSVIRPLVPQQKDLEGAFAITLSTGGRLAGAAELNVWHWASQWVAACENLFPALFEHETALRALLTSYQSQVADCRDVARLLMVARC